MVHLNHKADLLGMPGVVLGVLNETLYVREGYGPTAVASIPCGGVVFPRIEQLGILRFQSPKMNNSN